MTVSALYDACIPNSVCRIEYRIPLDYGKGKCYFLQVKIDNNGMYDV